MHITSELTASSEHHSIHPTIAAGVFRPWRAARARLSSILAKVRIRHPHYRRNTEEADTYENSRRNRRCAREDSACMKTTSRLLSPSLSCWLSGNAAKLRLSEAERCWASLTAGANGARFWPQQLRTPSASFF
eukprot:6206728-Pleurochrysis_carterae.AAC.1